MAFIDLPFTSDNAMLVLGWGIDPANSDCTHQDIADWCRRFWASFLDIDAPKEINRLLPTLNDVDAQWDLFLANTYSFDQLKAMDLDTIHLPKEWFVNWLRAVSI